MASTVTPVRTAPEESRTVPDTVAVCPFSGEDVNKKRRIQTGMMWPRHIEHTAFMSSFPRRLFLQEVS
jgi:hypothetical protein